MASSQSVGKAVGNLDFRAPSIANTPIVIVDGHARKKNALNNAQVDNTMQLLHNGRRQNWKSSSVQDAGRQAHLVLSLRRKAKDGLIGLSTSIAKAAKVDATAVHAGSQRKRISQPQEPLRFLRC